MCQVLSENPDIVNYPQLSNKMCELGHKDVPVTLYDIETAFGWISQSRQVEMDFHKWIKPQV
jgi:hypothetical protein